MNLFSDYQKKIFKSLKNLEKKKIIKIPAKLKNLLTNPKKYISAAMFRNDHKERVIADFIAGMTDRYAINLHKKIK